MAIQGIHGENHLTKREARHREGYVEPQVVVGAIQVFYSEFVKLLPPTFSEVDISEDPQQFLDAIGRVCRALGCNLI